MLADFLYVCNEIGCTPRGSYGDMLLRRVLGRFSSGLCRRFEEGLLEGALWNLAGGGVLSRVLRRGSQKGAFRWS